MGEDNDDVREEIIDMLRFEGYEVREAENGRLGLALVSTWVPDLVLCDLMMPEVDGYATLRAMRADPVSAPIPFVCLTARAERHDLRKAMELGADDYLTKPFTRDELVAAVNPVLAKRSRGTPSH
ncbi:MAG TPA: response regulator [Candidatus Binatus sp.]|nr:response regulator [Candidatus Binatus sp.]